MTKEELIKAQEKDIEHLMSLLKVKNGEILSLKESLQNNIQSKGTRKYQFDTPYFRIDAYGIHCYVMLAYEETHWQDKGIHDYYRFHDLFGFYLDDRQFGSLRHGYGGRRSLTTCISYAELMRRLGKRAKQNHKGKGAEYITLMSNINKEILNHKAWFSTFVETLAI